MRSQNSSIAKATKAIIEEASELLFSRLPVSDSLVEFVSFTPYLAAQNTRGPAAWMMGLHPSHRLWHAGGLAFCSKCGSVCMGVSKTELFRECGHRGRVKDSLARVRAPLSVKNKVIPPGSEGRIRRLIKGKIDYGRARWPDGTAKDVVIPPSRFIPVRKADPVSFSSAVESSAGVLPESSSSFATCDAIAGPSRIFIPQVPKRAFFWLYEDDDVLEEQADPPVKRSRFRALEDFRGETGADSELSQ